MPQSTNQSRGKTIKSSHMTFSVSSACLNRMSLPFPMLCVCEWNCFWDLPDLLEMNYRTYTAKNNVDPEIIKICVTSATLLALISSFLLTKCFGQTSLTWYRNDFNMSKNTGVNYLKCTISIMKTDGVRTLKDVHLSLVVCVYQQLPLLSVDRVRRGQQSPCD